MPPLRINSLVKELIEAFPFHLIFDFDFNILQMEKSLQQLHSDLMIGGRMPDIFDLSDFSDSPLNFADIKTKSHKSYYLKHREQHFCLKGQILRLKQSQIYVFVGNLIFDDLIENTCPPPEKINKPLNLLTGEYKFNRIGFADYPNLVGSAVDFYDDCVPPETALPVKNEVLPWQEIVNRIIGDLCLESGWDLSVLWVFDPQQKKLVCRHVWGKKEKHRREFEKETQKITFAPGVGLPGRVFAEAKPI